MTTSNKFDLSSLNSEMESLLNSVDLEKVLSSDKAELAAEKAAKGDIELLNSLKKVGGLITAYKAYTYIEPKSSVAGNTIIKAMVGSVGYLNKVDKSTKDKYSFIARNYLLSQNVSDSILQLFDEAIKLLSGYTKVVNKYTDTNVIGIDSLVSESGVTGYLTTTGINFNLKKGTKVSMTKNKEIVSIIANSDVSRTVNTSTLNRAFVASVSGVRIHNEYKTTNHKDGEQYATEKLKISDVSMKPNSDSVISTFLLLAGSDIDINTLISERNNSRPLGLVLYTDSTTKSIKRVSNPAHKLPNIYGKTGIMSAKEAALGLVDPTVDICNLAYKVDSEHVYLIEAPAKVAARKAKNNGNKFLWTRPNTKVHLVIGNVKSNDKVLEENINAALAGGAGFSSDTFEEENGPVRAVSESTHGLLKTAISTSKMIPNINSFEGIIVGMGAFKGSALGALSLMGVDIDVAKLAALSDKKEQAEDLLLNLIQKSTKTMLIADGIEADVLEFNIDLKITNSYAIDSLLSVRDNSLTLENKKVKLFRNLELIEQSCETGTVAYNSLRNEVIQLIKAEQNGGAKFSMLGWIKDSLNSGKVVYKEDITRIISSELQSMAHWYGNSTAVSFIRQLNEQAKELGLPSTQFLASDYLSGNHINKVIKTVSSNDISNHFRNSDFEAIRVQSIGYKRFEEFSLFMDNCINEKDSWIEVVFDDKSVYIPTGFDLVNDAFDRLSEIHSEGLEYGNVVLKGLLYELIQACHDNDPAHIKAKLQEHILGKALGYLRTVGFYGMNAPLLTKPEGYIACVDHKRVCTERLSTGDKVAVATEAPAHFYGANSCFIIGEADVGEFSPMYRRVAFVNPISTLKLGNDFDGDETRISKGITNEYQCIYTQFNGEFFENRVNSELKGNKFKVKFPKLYTMDQIHSAIYDASVSGEKVGMYTTNSYHFERLLPTLVEEGTVVTRTGSEISITDVDAYQICAILKQLLQVEAMDGMKHIKGKGSLAVSKTVTEDLLIWNLARNEEFGSYSADDIYGLNVSKAYSAISLYSSVNNDLLTDEEIRLYSEAMVYVASNYYNPEFMMASSAFDNKAVGEKFIKFEKDEDTLTNYYDFEGQLDVMLGEGDQCSIYNTLLANLVNNVNDAREVSK